MVDIVICIYLHLFAFSGRQNANIFNQLIGMFVNGAETKKKILEIYLYCS